MYAHINHTQKKRTTKKINNNNIKKMGKKLRKKYKNCAICTLTKSQVQKKTKKKQTT